MEIVKKPDARVFASNAKTGEILAFPDVLRGWGVTLDQTQGKPPLEWMNDAFNRIDLNNLYLLQQGIPEWDAATRYPVNSVIKHADKLYLCIAENENNEPSANSEKWALYIRNASEKDAGILKLATQEEVNTGTNDTNAVTPKKLDEKLKKLPEASLTQKGIAQLTNTIDDSEDKAVTPSGVKNAIASIDLAPDVSQIFYFDSPTVPRGYIAREGQSIDAEKMPKLFARYGANMPDDRNRVHRMYGDLAGSVGTTQEDATQKIYGTFPTWASGSDFSGIVAAIRVGSAGYTGGSYETYNAFIDNSRSARTATEERVKSRIVIACNRIQ